MCDMRQWMYYGHNVWLSIPDKMLRWMSMIRNCRFEMAQVYEIETEYMKETVSKFKLVQYCRVMCIMRPLSQSLNVQHKTICIAWDHMLAHYVFTDWIDTNWWQQFDNRVKVQWHSFNQNGWTLSKYTHTHKTDRFQVHLAKQLHNRLFHWVENTHFSSFYFTVCVSFSLFAFQNKKYR